MAKWSFEFSCVVVVRVSAENGGAAEDQKKRLRLALLALVLVGLFVLADYYNLAERFDVDAVRELVLSTGAWGWSLYIAVFTGGEFLHVPGMVFVAAGILVYGKLIGFGLAFLASVVSVSFSFVVVRRIGGTPFSSAQKPWLQKGLAHLDDRPIRTVFVLRSVLWLAPLLNYALALTKVRFSDYVIGSALGLLAPVAGAAVFFDWLIALL